METERCPFNGVDCEYIPLARKVEEQAKEIERLREELDDYKTVLSTYGIIHVSRNVALKEKE